MKKDYISIIIPIYNCEKYLKKSLNSILAQDYDKYEILIIDNGSTDNSKNIIDGFKDDRIKYFRLEKPNVSAARNFGISQMNGEYVYFMDADDCIESNTFSQCINTIKKQDVDLVMFNYYKVSKNDKEIVKLPWTNEIIDNDTIKNELIPVMIYKEKGETGIMGSIWRIFTYSKNVKDLFFYENIKVAEDLLFCIQLFNRLNSIYVLDKALYNYYLNSSSALNSFRKDAIYLAIELHDIMYDMLEKENLLNNNYERFYKNKGRMYTVALSSCSRSNQKKEAYNVIKDISRLYRKDEFNYLRLNFPIVVKIIFVLLSFNSYRLLYILFRLKEKNRLKKYN